MLIVIVNEPVSFKKDKLKASFQYLKVYNLDSKYLVQWNKLKNFVLSIQKFFFYKSSLNTPFISSAKIQQYRLV